MSVSKRTRTLIGLLKYGGLWLNFAYHPYGTYLMLLQIFRYLYLIVVWAMTWNLFIMKGPSFLLTQTAVFIPLGFNIIGTSAFYFFHRNDIERVIAEGEANMGSYKKKWEQDVIASDTNLITRISDVLKYGLQGFAIIYMILPVTLDLVRASMGYDDEPYVVPLPLDGYFDEVKTRNFKFYTIIFASHLWFIFAVSETVSFQCLIFYLVSYITSEIKIIKKHLAMLVDDKDKRDELLDDWDFDYILQKHAQIIRLNGLQRKYITLPYMFQCVCATLSFCFVMFLINQVIGKDTVVTVLGCVFIVLLLVTVMIMCLAGEYLEEISEGLFLQLCDLPWYRQRPGARKDLMMMLMQSNRTLVLDYRSHFPLNLRTYMQIINSAYSYYMLMKSVS